MRVLIDPQVFLFQRVGGVSRLFAELAKNFSRRRDVDLVLPFGYTRNEYITRAFPQDMRMIKGAERLLRPRPLSAVNTLTRRPPGTADLVHHTFYLPEYIDRYRTKRRVSTVFDMIPEVMPEYNFGVNPHASKRDYLEASDAIICISETTKADLLHHWGDFGKPVFVTYLGVDGSFFSPVPPVCELPDQYILFVGRRGTYKNFALLAEAFLEVADLRTALHLVAVGGGPFDADESEFFARHKLAHRVHQIDVDEVDLPGVYAGARCMVFPSKYEGFGLPILEGFASRCPVVIADTPCLVEVAGGLATVVSPDDPTELVESLMWLTGAGLPGLPAVDAAQERAAEFTWSRTCAETLEIYQQTLGR